MGKRNRGSIFSSSACKLLHSGFDVNIFMADGNGTLSLSRLYEPWAGWFWWRIRRHSSAISARCRCRGRAAFSWTCGQLGKGKHGFCGLEVFSGCWRGQMEMLNKASKISFMVCEHQLRTQLS